MTHKTHNNYTAQDVMTRLDALESLLSLFSIYVKDLRTAINSQAALEARNDKRKELMQAVQQQKKNAAEPVMAMPTPYKDDWLRQQSANRMLSGTTVRAIIESAVARSITYGVPFYKITAVDHSVEFWTALLTGDVTDNRLRKHMSYVLCNNVYFVRTGKNRFRMSDEGIEFAKQLAKENKCTLLL